MILRKSRYIPLVAAAIFAGLGAVAPAHAASWLEKNFWLSGPNYDGVLPPCEAALNKIARRFAQKESRFWNSSLQIVGFEGVRETAFRPWANGTIPRRYCSATAYVSDGRKHRGNYWIGDEHGMYGMSCGVEWCVGGLDRNRASNPPATWGEPH